MSVLGCREQFAEHLSHVICLFLHQKHGGKTTPAFPSDADQANNLLLSTTFCRK